MGRKAKVTAEKYIEAVIKTRGFNDTEIGNVIRVSRQAIHYFRLNNPDVVSEAKDKLGEIKVVRFDTIHTSREQYLELPIIKKWLMLMEDRELKPRTIRNRLVAFYNVCKELKVHPDKITLEMCSDLIRNIKRMDKQPDGLSYGYIRKPIRSYFELIHGVSGERLTSLGIKADRINMGAYASEFVTHDQRMIFEKALYRFTSEHFSNSSPDKITKVYNEIVGIVHFMFYTGSRISATRRIDCIDRKHKLNDPNLVEIHIIDKGDLHWNKKLIGDGIDRLNAYVQANLGIEDISQLSTVKGKLFPWINEQPHNMRIELKIVRQALEYAGVVDLMQPNHIWRHTFAQEALRSTIWNYEIVASLGGWSTSEELKKSYGKMGDDVLNKGLMAMLGITVESELYIFRW